MYLYQVFYCTVYIPTKPIAARAGAPNTGVEVSAATDESPETDKRANPPDTTGKLTEMSGNVSKICVIQFLW